MAITDLSQIHPGKRLDISANNTYEVLQCLYPHNPATGRALYRIKDTRNQLDYALKLFELRRHDGHELRREMVALNQRNRRPDLFPRCQQYTEQNIWGLLRLDWLDGTPLSTAYPHPPQDGHELTLRLETLKQLCLSLDVLHKNRLWHRDLKPDNVLLRKVKTPRDGVMLIDFGLSAQCRMHSEGTLGYQAPEQEGNRSLNLGDATDIFAVGQIGWWLVTGTPRNAFPDPEYKNWDPLGLPSLSDLVPFTPLGLDEVLARAMAYRPEKRYRSANDLYHDLNKFTARTHGRR